MNDGDSPVTLSRGRTRPPDPKVIGTCRIEARLGDSPSRLYRAVDVSLGKTVVIKLMVPPHDEHSTEVERFLAFGSALVGLTSPHVVPVLRAGRDGPTPYIVFDYVDGEDVELLLRRDRGLLPQAALRVALDAASGLEAARQRGVLHGDIRPRHLIRTRTGEVKITGFGLTPVLRTAQGRELSGHPAYLAPEIIQMQPADHRADIYALGCTLFELLTGRPPYGSGSADALLACHVHEPFPSLRGLIRASAELESFLGRLVHKNPEKRFSTYTELLQAGAALLPVLRQTRPAEPELVIHDGRDHERFAIPEGDLLIGRTPGEGIALDDARVSRRHAIIRRTGDYIEVEDLGSRNGIRVNGVEAKTRQLLPGDRLDIGDTVLRLEAPASAVAQIPAQRPPSPVRGAFGDLEISHPPQRQAGADALTSPDAGTAEDRVLLLGRLAPLFAARSGPPEALWQDAISIAADVLRADHRLVIHVRNREPLFEAATAFEAQLLSGTLPAVERALPGQLALATCVRVNIDDRWNVLLAPILERGQTRALAVLVKRIGRFDETALTMLEACCALLGLRGEAPTT